MREFEKNLPLTKGQWFCTLLVLCLPLIDIIMLFVWAFGNGKVGRKNFASALLVLTLLITVALAVIWFTVDLSAYGIPAQYQNLNFFIAK